MPDSLASSSNPAGDALLAPVFAAIREPGALPSVGNALSRLTHLLERDDEAVHHLSDAILDDLSLTQRLLHLANTLPFRTGPVPVTTVTRAVMLLGFNRVRAIAVSLVLLDGVVGAANVARVRDEFHQALLAGNLAAALLTGDEAEEACIAAMFRHIGRLLVAVHAPAALDAVRAGVVADEATDAAAARRALGVSFDDLTSAALTAWRVPDRIMAAVQPLPPRIEAARSAAERVRAAAQFADEAAAISRRLQGLEFEAAMKALRDRFEAALPVSREAVDQALRKAGSRVEEFEQATGIRLSEERPADATEEEDIAPEGAIAAPEVAPSMERDAVGRPANSRDLLLAGLADMTELMARGADLDDLFRVALETLFSGLGFGRAALVLRDPGTGAMRVRVGLGQPRPRFAFRADGMSDLFSAALARATDLHIADVASEKVRARLPEWFARDFASTRSFLLMPLTIGRRNVGFFYADRTCVDAIGLAPDELNVLRSLRGQVVLAMRGR